MKVQIKLPWVLGLVLIVLAVYGWVMNIATLWNMDFNNMTGQFIIRCIGVVFGPLGAILGYF